MVFGPPGLRPGSIVPDETVGMPPAPGTYSCHERILTAHNRPVLMRKNDIPLPMRWTVMQQTVQNYNQNDWCVSTDANFDILLVGAPVHSLKMIYLHGYCFNQNAVGGNAIRPLHFMAIINRLDMQLNGSFSDDTIYQEQIYQDYNDWLENDFERMGRAPYVNGETSAMVTNSGNNINTYTMWDESNNAIAPQAQREFFIPVICALTTMDAWLPRKLVDPRIKVYGAVNPICGTNPAPDLATPPLRFRGMETFVEGIVFEPDTRKRISAFYAQAPLLHRGIVHDRFTKDLGAWLVGAYVGDIQLTPFTGSYASMCVWVNRNDATREQLVYGSNRPAALATLNPLPLQVFSFTDSSGYHYYYPDYRANFIRCQNNDKSLNCLMRQFKAYYMHYFCTDPQVTLRTGKSTGGLAMDGSNIFRLQVDAQATQGTTTGMTAVFDARRYAMITVTDTFVLKKL